MLNDSDNVIADMVATIIIDNTLVCLLKWCNNCVHTNRSTLSTRILLQAYILYLFIHHYHIN